MITTADSKTKINIGLVEDQFLFRRGMKAILKTWPELEVMFEAAEGYTVIEKLKNLDVIPDVMLVDLSLPPLNNVEYNGKEVMLVLSEHYPDMKIIILSGHEDENFIADMIESGAHGYLIKDSDPDELYEAITSVFKKGSYINTRALKAIQANQGKKKNRLSKQLSEVQLTKREEEVLEGICAQLTTEEIADKLCISPKTVNGYRISLLEKTGSINTAGLTLFAVRNGIVKA